MPGILEWCTTSLASLNLSLHEYIGKSPTNARKIKDTSPFLAWIQDLSGSTPGEKYENFNRLILYMIENMSQESEENFLRETDDVSPVVRAIISTTIGNRIRSRRLVVEGLKSEHRWVVKKALSADWFFHGSNFDLTPDYLLKQVLPETSLYARNRIIAKLSRCLRRGYASKAEEFFNKFSSVFGVRNAFPLLYACSEDFAVKFIEDNTMMLSAQQLHHLYTSHPDVAIKYLQNRAMIFRQQKAVAEGNMKKSKMFQYDHFHLKIISKYPKVFVDLFLCTPNKRILLSSRKASILLKHQRDRLIKEPYYLLQIFKVKDVQKKLKKSEFEEMLSNYLNCSLNMVNFKKLLELLKGYPHDESEFLTNLFHERFGENLIEDSSESTLDYILRFYRPEQLQERVKTLLSKRPALDINDLLYKFLPPEEVLEKLEERLARFPHNSENPKFFKTLVQSCQIYNRYTPIIKALTLYKLSGRQYTDFLERFYESLDDVIDDEFQDDDVAKALIRFDAKAHEYFQTHDNLNYYTRCNRLFLWKICQYMIRTGQDESDDFDSRYVCEWFTKTLMGLEWNEAFENKPDLQRRLLEHVLKEIPYFVRQYETDEEENEKKSCCDKKQSHVISVLTSLMEVIDGHNKKARKDAIVLEEYPEVYKAYEKYLRMNVKGMSYEYLCQTFQQTYPKLFNKICRSDDTSDENKRAVKIAKRLYFDYNDMQFDEYWKDYLEFCKKWLKRYKGHLDRMAAIQLAKAQQLLKRVKWYQDVPWKFVESCLEDINDPGNIGVLAYLLEGPAFEKLIKGKDCLDNAQLSVIKVEPPVSFKIVEEMKNVNEDTVALLSSLVRRLPLNQVMSFVEQAAEAPSELKIVYFKALLLLEPLDVSHRLVGEFWQSEQDGPNRAFAIKKIIDHFKNWPNPESLQMLKQCIETIDDSEMQNYIPVNNLICECDPAYLSAFIDCYLEKIGTVRTAHRSVLTCTVAVYLDAVRAQLVADDVLKKLAMTYFDANDGHMMIVVGRFIVDSYLLGARDDRTFNERMTYFKDKILAEIYKIGATRFEHFVTQSLNEFQQNVGVKHDRKLKVLEAFDQYFESGQLNRTEKVDLFFNIKIYQEFLRSETPEQFADRLVKLIPKLLARVPDLSSTVCYTVLLSAILPINNFSDSTIKNRPSGVFRVAKCLAQNKTHQLAPNIAVDLLYNYENMRDFDLPTYQETLKILKACEVTSVAAAVQRIVNLMETKRIQ